MTQPTKLAALLAFAALPLLEIGLLIRVGQAIGLWPLAAIVVATAILGGAVIRRVGMSIFSRALSGLETGSSGIEPLFDGFLQVLAGMLLIFPGLMSDILGLLLLLPMVRARVITSGLLKLVSIFHYQAEVSRGSFRERTAEQPEADHSGVTIEGEYERISEEAARRETALRPRRAGK